MNKKIVLLSVSFLLLASFTSVSAVSEGDKVTWTIDNITDWESGAFNNIVRDTDMIRISTGDYVTTWTDDSVYVATWDEGWEIGASENVDVTGINTLRIKYEYRAVKTEDGLSISPFPHGEFKVEDETNDNFIGYEDTETDTWQIKEFTYDVSNLTGEIELLFWLTGAGSGDSEKYKGEMQDHEIEKYIEATFGTWTDSKDWDDYSVRVENVIMNSVDYNTENENIWIKVGSGSPVSWTSYKLFDNTADAENSFSLDSYRISYVKTKLETDDTSHSPYVDNMQIEAVVTQSAPNTPENLSPTGVCDNTDVILKADISHPFGENSDVYFYDAETDEFIGSDLSVVDGGTASTTWTGLSQYRSHSFYVQAVTSGGELESDVSDTARFWSSMTGDFQITVRDEENNELWSGEKINDNLTFTFKGEDWTEEIVGRENNPAIYKIGEAVDYVIANYSDYYTRKLLTHGDNEVIFMLTDDLDTLNSYILNLDDPVGVWGPPDGEIQLYKYFGGIKYRIYDSTWYAQDMVEVPLLKYSEYYVRLTNEDGKSQSYGSIMAGTYGEKTITPRVAEEEENKYEGYLGKYITFEAEYDGSTIDITYQDNDSKTNWVYVQLENSDGTVVDSENKNTSPNDWTYSYGSPQENMTYLASLQINHDNLGEVWTSFPVRTENITVETIPGVESVLGDFPTAFATFASAIVLIIGLFAIAPRFAGVGCIMTGVLMGLLWFTGYLNISPFIVVVTLFIGFLVEAGESKGAFG